MTRPRSPASATENHLYSCGLLVGPFDWGDVDTFAKMQTTVPGTRTLIATHTLSHTHAHMHAHPVRCPQEERFYGGEHEKTNTWWKRRRPDAWHAKEQAVKAEARSTVAARQLGPYGSERGLANTPVHVVLPVNNRCCQMSVVEQAMGTDEWLILMAFDRVPSGTK